MITAGVDLASLAQRTAACRIKWEDQHAVVEDLVSPLDDDGIASLIATSHKVGIDVPLGWPSKFVDAVSQHAQAGSWPASYDHAQMEEYRFRATDRWLRDELRCPPLLSVSSDLIAVPAMRAAAVLSRLPERVALDGSGVVVEVYPSIALRQWGFASRGYKGRRGAETRADLVEDFVECSKTWLHLSEEHRTLCTVSDDAFDAVIAGLVARASAVGLVEEIPDSDAETALQEGWIAVPLTGTFEQLTSPGSHV